jgi:integrase
MPAVHLTDALVRRLEAPTTGNKITYDTAVKGFGARVTANGARSYVLTYSTHAGRQRRITIGSFPDWNTTQARERAKELKREVDAGGDPLGAIEDARAAPTMADLVSRFEAEHLVRKRKTTAADYRLMIKTYVAPHFDNRKVQEIAFSDCDALHRKISEAGHLHRANRVAALLSKMFALAIKWNMRVDNPARGIDRNKEHPRRRYLKPDEIQRLTAALIEFPEQDVVDAVRLLLLTGARKDEVLSMKWEHLDIGTGAWKKPPSSVKQNEAHEVPLSAPARMLLAERMGQKADDETYVFPGRGGRHHLGDFWHSWRRLLKAAGIKNLRIHDLRHSFASELVSGGASLPMIGSLLGHRNPATTNRYAHLYPDAQLAAVERVGAAITNAGKEAPPPTPLRRGRS